MPKKFPLIHVQLFTAFRFSLTTIFGISASSSPPFWTWASERKTPSHHFHYFWPKYLVKLAWRAIQLFPTV